MWRRRQIAADLFTMNIYRNKLIFVAVAVIALAATAFGDIRIRFAKGRDAAVVNGRISRGGRTCYKAGVRAGQRITAIVTSKTGKVRIFESGETSYEAVTEYAGDESICVDNLSGPTSYTLTVTTK